jgi:hypothetical protein
MSKSLSKFDFFGETKNLQKSVRVLGRTIRVIAKLFEVKGASSKTSKEIDEAIVIAFGEELPEELNGLLISDPTNHYLLIRQGGIWKKIKVE